MSSKITFYPESKFGGFTDIDGSIAFFSRVNSLLKSNFVVLDAGCGRGATFDDDISFRKDLKVLKGKVTQVIGIDVDPEAKNNSFIDKFHLIKNNKWPLDDSSIDLIICDNVLEHIENPELFFSEVSRVLKRGGYYCFRTPNAWSYIAIIAKIIPNKYHSKITSIVQDSRMEEDVFPTLYRCNTIGKLKRLMKKNGFDYEVYGYEAEPSYLSFSSIIYYLGVLHQRFAPQIMKAAIFRFGKLIK